MLHCQHALEVQTRMPEYKRFNEMRMSYCFGKVRMNADPHSHYPQVSLFSCKPKSIQMESHIGVSHDKDNGHETILIYQQRGKNM